MSSNGLPAGNRFGIASNDFSHINIRRKGKNMSSKDEELILKTVKEIVVKFIETGNMSPTSFHDHFRNIYNTVANTVGSIEYPNEGAAKPKK